MSRDMVAGNRIREGQEPIDRVALSKRLEEGYLAQRREAKFTQKYSFSPSNIAGYHGQCGRYWSLAFTGGTFEETTDAMGIATMKNGVDAGKRIQNAFKEAGILVAEEVEVKIADPPIRGFVDVLVRWNDEIIVGEIKNTREESWVHRNAQMKPSAQHLYQLLIYLKATGKKRGFLLYENKNSLQFVIIPIEYNEENEKILEDALEWMRLVRKTWEDGKLPMRPYPSKRNKVCKACPVVNWCWDELPEGEVAIPAMEVVTP